MASTQAASRKPSVGLGQYRRWLDRGIFILSLLGILVVSHLGLQASRGFVAGCAGFTPGEITAGPSGCEAALQSDYATFLGISNVALGLTFYLLVAGLSYAIAVVAAERISTLKKVRGAILALGFVYALYLTYVLLSGRSDGICGLCLTSHVITFLMFTLFVIDFNSKPAVSRK